MLLNAISDVIKPLLLSVKSALTATPSAVNAALTSSDNGLTASNIAFSNINIADLNAGSLTGTNTDNEVFTITTTDNAVNVNDIDFTQVSVINAGTSGEDAIVTTGSAVNAALVLSDNGLTASSMTFSNINNVDLSLGELTGTDGRSERFIICVSAS